MSRGTLWSQPHPSHRTEAVPPGQHFGSQLLTHVTSSSLMALATHCSHTALLLPLPWARFPAAPGPGTCCSSGLQHPPLSVFNSEGPPPGTTSSRGDTSASRAAQQACLCSSCVVAAPYLWAMPTVRSAWGGQWPCSRASLCVPTPSPILALSTCRINTGSRTEQAPCTVPRPGPGWEGQGGRKEGRCWLLHGFS